MTLAQRVRHGLLVAGVALAMSLLYLAAMLYYTGGHLAPTIDDVFIHFQYARQLAAGRFLQYNTGDPASTGATSLLYVLVLAVPHLLGLEGPFVILFAYLLNTSLLVASGLLVYGWVERLYPPEASRPSTSGVALVAALLFVLSGPLLWGYLGGMEIGLFTTLMLATLYSYTIQGQGGRYAATAIFGSLLAAARPEGVILALLLVLALIANAFRYREQRGPQVIWLLLPLLVAIGQGLLSYWATGSWASNGMRYKSLLYTPGVLLPEVVFQVVGYYRDLLKGMFSGFSTGDWGSYFAPFLFLFFILGLAPLVGELRQRYAGVHLLAASWFFLGVLSTTVSGLAGWHYNRYQMPFFAIVIVFGVLGTARLAALLEPESKDVALLHPYKGIGTGAGVFGIFSLFFLGFACLSALWFAAIYGKTAYTMYYQPMAMGKWIDTHLPPDARVATGDVGAIKYYGRRHIFDLLGLVTNDQAEAARLGGSGSIYERLERLNDQERPTYFVLFPGASPLIDAGVAKDEVYRLHLFQPWMTFGADLVVYKADWSLAHSGDAVRLAGTLKELEGYAQVDRIDVADLESERAHSYRTWPLEIGLFPATAIWNYPYEQDPALRVADGGRVVTGGEEMEVATAPGRPMKIVMRTAAGHDVQLRVTVNDRSLGLWSYPRNTGGWVERIFDVPGSAITDTRTKVHLELVVDRTIYKDYTPFHYWFYQAGG